GRGGFRTGHPLAPAPVAGAFFLCGKGDASLRGTPSARYRRRPCRIALAPARPAGVPASRRIPWKVGLVMRAARGWALLRRVRVGEDGRPLHVTAATAMPQPGPDTGTPPAPADPWRVPAETRAGGVRPGCAAGNGWCAAAAVSASSARWRA